MKDTGIIFDWDGVVIDSSAQHEHSWDLLAAEVGKTLPPGHFKKGFGKKNQSIIPDILGWTNDPAEIDRLGARKEELYRELVRKESVRILPGARELLEALKAAGIPRSLGSSTPRSNLNALFEVTGIDELFDAVVCGDDVIHGKPAPDIFLLAANRLGLSPSRCIVIEDAHVGIEAAKRGGMKVVAVATTHPLAELNDADIAVQSLEEVSPRSLAELMDG